MIDIKQFIQRNRPSTADLVLTAGAASLVLVCLFLLGSPALHHLQDRARCAEVQGNAATLQLAAETYAFRNDGRYPVDPLDLVELLPGRTPPVNPLTGEALRFRVEPGDLTYRSPSRGGDYVIEAWGGDEDSGPTRLLVLRGKRR